MHRRSAAILFALAILMVLLSRILGPSDLYDKEQPRTTSYTADMLLNGRWIMPHDATGEPATKPPLYNWISVPFVALAGFQEWALRSTSPLAAALTAWILFVFARWLARRGDAARDDERALAQRGTDVAWLAVVIWLVSFSTFRLFYLARPDMLLVACTTGAWALGTMALFQEDPRGRWKPALGFWLCVGLAGLAKGPMMVVPILYVVIGARLLVGRWNAIHRTAWWWGLPLALGILALWLVPAYRAEPEHFRTVLFGKEMAGRVGGPLVLLARSWRIPQYSITPFVPWSFFALAAMAIIPFRRWLRHPLAPAIVWIWLVAICFACILTTRADRFAPMFPATAVIAAFVMIHLQQRWRQAGTLIAPGVLAMALVLMVYRIWFTDEARNHTGERLDAFVQTIHDHVHHDAIAFYGVGMTPLETLLGYCQAGEPTPALLRQARWVVRPYTPGDDAVAISKPVEGIAPDDQAIRLALLRIGDLTPGPSAEVRR